jgi:signal transduction histidine kinase
VELQRLAAEQAALRRVAMLVAGGADPHEVFAAVVDEVSHVIGSPLAEMTRYDEDGMATVLASTGTLYPVGSRWPIEAPSVTAAVFESGRAARIDDYSQIRGAIADVARDAGYLWCVGVPIIVDGRLWGLMATGSQQPEALPGQTEARLAEFTDLVATAIANAESRAALARLAREQAALRRVATLVARGAQPEQVLAGLAEEIAQVLGFRAVAIDRYDGDASLTVVAAYDDPGFPVGSRWPLDGPSLAATILETRTPGRVDDYSGLDSTIAAVSRRHSITSRVGVPVLVEGAVWGAVYVGSYDPEPLPSDTEQRLAAFTELLETAISNAQSRAELMASRARVVAAADETRRRIERDLHDGIQQGLVSLALQLRSAVAMLPSGKAGDIHAELARLAEGLTAVQDELREISRGIHPATLSEGGLASALKTIARRSPIPVELEVRAADRLPEHVEVAAYYIVSEAFTNAAKHAQASLVEVHIRRTDGPLQLSVRDDGVGGADPRRGSGLTGLADRIEALGGTIEITSPPGHGTSLLVSLPIEDH